VIISVTPNNIYIGQLRPSETAAVNVTMTSQNVGFVTGHWLWEL
jgi:hypothetical protein